MFEFEPILTRASNFHTRLLIFTLFTSAGLRCNFRVRAHFSPGPLTLSHPRSPQVPGVASAVYRRDEDWDRPIGVGPEQGAARWGGFSRPVWRCTVGAHLLRAAPRLLPGARFTAFPWGHVTEKKKAACQRAGFAGHDRRFLHAALSPGRRAKGVELAAGRRVPPPSAAALTKALATDSNTR